MIVRKFASAFFGTNRPSLLVSLVVDTVILAGCSTSGWIQAAAIDGVSHGYRVMVPEECVSDRAEEPHRANLFDIDSKYGDVVSLKETLWTTSSRSRATEPRDGLRLPPPAEPR